MVGAAAKSTRSTPCPKCGSVISITCLEVEGDEQRERVYFITCPRGDLDIAITDQQVADVVGKMVLERLRSGDVQV